jgi:hypothetical protein
VKIDVEFLNGDRRAAQTNVAPVFTPNSCPLAGSRTGR